MTDAARQRTNMVENQILTSDVTDRRILQAMGALPLERFVHAAWAALVPVEPTANTTMAARMARMMMTMRSSMSVNPPSFLFCFILSNIVPLCSLTDLLPVEAIRIVLAVPHSLGK